eukprot:GFUD01030317.1.p1 GENE.GFUD01030317.1~~GFUD01030317.1.p1  ORF type:complete len:293 (-),score=73.57 GFUD01030317.1:48-926(-)
MASTQNMDEQEPNPLAEVKTSKFLTLACICSIPFSLLMFCVGIDSMSICPAETRVSFFLVFQSLTWITVSMLRIMVHLIEFIYNRGSCVDNCNVPGLGMVSSVATLLFFFSSLWAVKFTPTIVTLQPVFDDKTDIAHCPAFVYYLALTYCGLVTFMVGSVLIIVMFGIIAGLVHPEFLVTTGFLKAENILLDFRGEDENDIEEEPESKWRKVHSVESLTGQSLGSLTPTWAGVAVSPVGLRSAMRERLNSGGEEIRQKQFGGKLENPGMRRSGSEYLRAALNNSTREEKRIS